MHSSWSLAMKSLGIADQRPFKNWFDDWDRFVGQVDRRYQQTLYDYRNRLDTRTIIQPSIDLLDIEIREAYTDALEPVDQRFRSATWDSARRWSSTAQPGDWCASRLPLRIGDELARDLHDEHITFEFE